MSDLDTRPHSMDTDTALGRNEGEDVACSRTTRSSATKKVSECFSDDLQLDDELIGPDGCDLTDADELEVEPVNQACCSTNLLEEDGKFQQRKNQMWSANETHRFYQGLKEYGKGFDQLSKFMSKYKMNRDKVQIQKYYFNLVKTFRALAKIGEDDNRNVPRDAKELFIVINGCEWKHKTNGAKICPETFRRLLSNGVATAKLKSRRVVIKTPICNALRQFFKYDEKFATIPKQLSLRLTPATEDDKNYVLSCEQNPLVYLKLDMNDSLQNIFYVLSRKWIPKYTNPDNVDYNTDVLPSIKLRSNFSSFPKMIIRHGIETLRRLSLNSLIQYCESTRDGLENPPVDFPASPSSSNHSFSSVKKKSKNEDPPSCIVIDSSSPLTTFNFRTEILQEGLTHENVSGISGLQLYLITGMLSELKFSYSVENLSKPKSSIWELFVNFVKRDYLWYGTDYMIHGTTNTYRKRKKMRQKPPKENKVPSIDEPEAIVEDEMLGFLEQWNSMSKTSAQLHQAEPQQDGQSLVTTSTQTCDDDIQSAVKAELSADANGAATALQQKEFLVPSARPRSFVYRKRKAADQIFEKPPAKPVSVMQRVLSAVDDMPSSSSDAPTDFSSLNMGSRSPNAEHAKLPPASSSSLLDDSQASLHKALTDEFSNQIGLMAQQTSVDYCRQFEEFVNFFQSPQKLSK